METALPLSRLVTTGKADSGNMAHIMRCTRCSSDSLSPVLKLHFLYFFSEQLQANPHLSLPYTPLPLTAALAVLTPPKSEGDTSST